MILEIDAGNTSLKWRVVNAMGDVVSRGRHGHSHEYADISKQLDGLNVRSARVSCVAGVQTESNIKQWLDNFGSIKVCIARTLKSFAGLQVAYDNPERLGVDRWLAMLAAWSPGQACCVVDCGSAITVDLVNADGVHLGGYIVPGLKIMRSGLLGETGQIKMEPEAASSSLAPGVNTSQAVNNGILRMAVSFVQSVLDVLDSNGNGWKVVMTGGDMDTINQFISAGVTIECVPELVLDGLSIALG